MSQVTDALALAVASNPESIPLRLHLAELLAEEGKADRCMIEVSAILVQDPGNMEALSLAAKCRVSPRQKVTAPMEPVDDDIDWEGLEASVGIELPAPFTEDEGDQGARLALSAVGGNDFQIEDSTVTLADVGGLELAKERINRAFLEPLNRPDLAQAFGKQLRGGLLLYGPPGTGKTFLAKAVAGELGAKFLTATLSDVIGSYIGESEERVHQLFVVARQSAPCVLFIDEIDSLGGKRSHYQGAAWMRNVVNQLLQEMDGVSSTNDGVFVLGATNHPWDVDEALLRPGRFDRMVLVQMPDAEARRHILQRLLKDRPIAGINLGATVKATKGFSGADLDYLVQVAVEQAMVQSVAQGVVCPITMREIDAALGEVSPSGQGWLQSARNVVAFANADGRYDDLKKYLKHEKML